MLSTDKFYNALSSNGVDLFTGVPDSLLKDFCAYVTDHTDAHHNIIAANEGAAVGIAAGHYLATGNLPIVYMQNSGIGNAVNPLMSLADDRVYSLPMLLLIGWRGEPGVHDEPQHARQGEVTLPLLEAMRIPYHILPAIDEDGLETLAQAAAQARELSKPVALVVRKGTFSSYSLKNKPVNTLTLTREQALEIIIGTLAEDAVTVSTTGKLSRELFELRERIDKDHSRDFLTVGSMGHSSSIALGIALEHPERPVVVLDGDGAFLMHMGAITNIGTLAPANLLHIVVNNGAHESVGGQPTAAFSIDIPAVARACGYRATYSADSDESLRNSLSRACTEEGPTLIEVKTRVGSRPDLGRPTNTPVQNRDLFMSRLHND